MLLGIVYFAVSAGAVASTRFDGGVAFLWIANAILTARLSTLPARAWAAPILICFIGNAITTATIGLGPALILPLGVANVGESAIGAILLQRLVGPPSVFHSHRWLIVFVLATGIAAPLAGAVVAASAIALIAGHPFIPTALHWYNGHALGTLAFMPVAMMILRGDVTRLLRTTPRAKLIEQATLIGMVGAVSVVTFSQSRLPLLFLPMLPVVLATFRGGALSTSASIVVLTLVGGALTLYGVGPISLFDAPVGARMQFLQLYIACTMLTVLPANAELERRAELFRRLRESEARYRLVTENSTDIVLNVDREGRMRFVSSSIRQIGGHEPSALIGQPLSALIHPEDTAHALASLQRTIDDPQDVTISEYRGFTTAGDLRWFETHSRAVTDDRGEVTGVVSAIRDVTQRKAHEERLARAALTDPLTGLVNRRALTNELAARIASDAGGCVALFDLDHFKRVNDTFGHATGDEVLRRFAAIARSSVREQDIVARLGGEEFAVVMPEATIDQASLVCDRLRRAVAAARLRVNDSVVRVTVSVGVGRYAAGQTVEAVLHAADVALYDAKHAGRDRLIMAA